ncbi:hypothetical protein PAXRUDRAFT_829710 [Paxillus rubicundulus Ve08.2h10]|uniref:Uncharacterized protein n=1 Tax=Paxillus rubicundulus Ve08.2h10 TaxID=930991 RepID=A0A0D0DUG4_9AGAM|nr:hypothetical protein PAXRUDRAFT_829710 [Paxillus rubicundulus Ve08.2h10]
MNSLNLLLIDELWHTFDPCIVQHGQYSAFSKLPQGVDPGVLHNDFSRLRFSGRIHPRTGGSPEDPIMPLHTVVPRPCKASEIKMISSRVTCESVTPPLPELVVPKNCFVKAEINGGTGGDAGQDTQQDAVLFVDLKGYVERDPPRPKIDKTI